jgi:hypothetical protein
MRDLVVETKLVLWRVSSLESRGRHVTSVLGNDEALRLYAAVIAAADSIVIGCSAPILFEQR